MLKVAPRPRSPSHASADFRKDIDGLRAIAVLPVVLFHAGIPGFSGGFIGVDVFFVISGFLITGILLRSINEGNYSIRHFYERRIKRILPALSLVLFVSTVIALIVYLPETLTNYGKSLASVSVFSSNFFFWKSIGYFAEPADAQPLLHTWSLAVEEQFYIFYPLLLWLLAKRALDVRRTLLIIAAGSLALSIYATFGHTGANFYLLPTRAWELMVGGLIAASPRVELRPQQVRGDLCPCQPGDRRRLLHAHDAGDVRLRVRARVVHRARPRAGSRSGLVVRPPVIPVG